MVCGLLKWEGELVGGAWFAWEMAHDKTNGKWEWQRSMGHDELGDMGMFSAHEKGGLLKAQAPPF